MSRKPNIDNESFLNADTPILNSVGQNNPFQVPENYFQNFEQQIMQQVKFVKPINPVNEFLSKVASTILQPQFAAAASLILILGTAVTLYFSDLGFDTSLITESHNTIPPVVHVEVTDNLPPHQLFDVTFQEDNDQKHLTVLLSPTLSPEQFNEIIVDYPIANPILPVIQTSVEQYFAHQELMREHEQEIPQNNYANSPIDQNFQTYVPQVNQTVYNPQYSGNTPNPPYHQTTVQLPENKIPIVNNVPPQVKNPVHQTNGSGLPDFALPEFVCSESAFELEPYEKSPNLKYVWSTGERTPSITVRSTGVYTLTIYHPDRPEIIVTSQTSVRIIPKVKNSIPTHEILCSGQSLILDPQIENPELYTYFWLPTYDTVKNLSVKYQGLYVLAITGCNTYFDSVLVTKEHCDIHIPNIITPNNDGINDFFTIFGIEQHPETMLTVYDRNGSIAYNSMDYQNNWDGNNSPDGTYYYILRFKDGLEKHGTLTILR